METAVIVANKAEIDNAALGCRLSLVASISCRPAQSLIEVDPAEYETKPATIDVAGMDSLGQGVLAAAPGSISGTSSQKDSNSGASSAW